MKALSIIVLILVLPLTLAAATIADTDPDKFLRLENDTQQAIVYAVIKSPPAEIEARLLEPSRLFFSLQKDWDHLASSTFNPCISTENEEILVLGISLDPSGIWPVWYLRLNKAAYQGSLGKLSVSKAKPFLKDRISVTLDSRELDLNYFKARVDGRYIEWLKYNDTLRFSRNSLPIKIFQTNQSATVQIAATQARWLRKAGTDLERLVFVKDGNNLYLMAGSFSPFDKGFGLLLRVYGNDPTVGVQSQMIIDLRIAGPFGAIFLYPGQGQKTRIVGEYAWNGYYVEGRIRLDFLTDAQKTALLSGLVEVASSQSDGIMSEEFVLSQTRLLQ